MRAQEEVGGGKVEAVSIMGKKSQPVCLQILSTREEKFDEAGERRRSARAAGFSW